MKSTLLSALHVSEEILLSHYERPLHTGYKENKHSIVTTADLESEEAIMATIRARFPKHNILSEECGFVDNRSTYTWVIDPLDGTSNFAAGIPWFGTLIALFEDNQPVMAGATLPVNGDVYFCENGRTSLKNGRPLRISGSKPLSEQLVAFANDPVSDTQIQRKGLTCYKYLLKNSRNVRSTNSLVDFLFIAEGRFGCCINMCTKVWDIAALSLIISGAGGIMRTIDNQPVDFLIGQSLKKCNFSVMAGSYEIINTVGKELQELKI
ncbi:MAG: inositol monophosphatase family protein [Bacteroidota bacterium]